MLRLISNSTISVKIIRTLSFGGRGDWPEVKKAFNSVEVLQQFFCETVGLLRLVYTPLGNLKVH